MLHVHLSPSMFSRRHWLVGLLFAVLLACSVLFTIGGTAHAAPAVPCCPGPFNPSAAVTYANNHWNWPKYNSATPAVSAGQGQPNFQCAEFVARALAVGGYIPGINGYSSTQNALNNYKPGDGVTYDLLSVTPGLAPPDHTLQSYLTTFGLATNVGTSLSNIKPGDVVVFKDSSGTPQHMAIIVKVGSSRATTLLDAHNDARHQVSLASEAGGFTSFYILHLLQH